MKFWRIIIAISIASAITLPIYAVDPVQKGSMQLNLEVADPGGTETVTGTVILNHIKASEIEPFVVARLSRYGAVQVNDPMNMLIITDMEKKVADLIKTVKALDSPKMKEFLRLETAIIIVKNLQAWQLVDLIREKLSREAVIKIDNNLNTLLITDVKSKIDQTRELIEKLDIPIRQVMIEVKIVEIENNVDSKLGVDWRSILKSAQAAAGSVDLLNRISTKSDSTNKTNVTSGSTNTSDFSQNGYIRSDSLKASIAVQGLDTIIGLLISDGKGRILSSPRIVGSNNQRAYISDGEQIYYSTDQRNYSNNLSDTTNLNNSTSLSGGSSNANILGNMTQSRYENTNYIQAGINLSITPHIIADDLVTLGIDTQINNLTGWSPTGGPIISSRSANSTVTIRDGEAFVMGGLKKTSEVEVVDRWPVLGYIPLLDIIFSSRKQVKIANDVVLFITPTILKEYGKNINPSDREILEKSQNDTAKEK